MHDFTWFVCTAYGCTCFIRRQWSESERRTRATPALFFRWIYDHFERLNYFGARLRCARYAARAPAQCAHGERSGKRLKRWLICSTIVGDDDRCTASGMVAIEAHRQRNPCNYGENLSRQKFARGL